MSEPFLGEITMVGFSFAPVGWAFCNGVLLSIDQNTALYSLVGTTFGGDGQTNFNLPNLQGRIPIHQGTDPGSGATYIIGQVSGSETVTMLTNQLPAHTHTAQGQTGNGTQQGPTGRVWAASNLNQFSSAAPQSNMSPGAIAQAGGGVPHDNLMPFQVVNFIIALEGIFPSRN